MFLLDCTDSKKPNNTFEKYFTISTKWINYPGSSKLFCTTISPNDTLTSIKRAYHGCQNKQKKDLDNMTFRLAGCSQQLSLKNNKVEIWFEPLKGQEVFEMKNVNVVFTLDGKVTVEETSLNLSLRDY